MCRAWLSLEFSRETFPLSSGVHGVTKDVEALKLCFSATPQPAAWREDRGAEDAVLNVTTF